MDILKKKDFYILCACILACALFRLPELFDGNLMPRNIICALFIVVLLFSITYQAIKRKVDFGILKNWIFPAFFGYLLFTAISLFQATNVSEGLYGVMKISVMFFSLALIALAIDRGKLPKFMVLLGLGLAIYGLFSNKGTMNNENLWSAAQFLILPFCLICILSKTWWKYVGYLTTGIILFNLYNQRTRSIWLACLIAGMSAIIFKPKLVFVFILLAVIFSFALPSVLKSESFTNWTSWYERKELWTQTLRMFKHNTFGVGANNWRITRLGYVGNAITREGITKPIIHQRPHNEFLRVLSEIGPIGFLFYISIFGLGLVYAYRARNIPIFMGIVGCMAYAFLSFPDERIFHPLVFIVYIAMVLKSHHTWYVPKHVLHVASILVLSVMSLAIVDFYWRYEMERRAKCISTAHVEKDYRAILHYTEDISWFSTLDQMGSPFLFHRGTANYVIGNREQAMIDMKRANKLNPNDIFTLTNLGAFYIAQGKKDKAIDSLEWVMAIKPSYQIARNNLNVARKK